MRLEVPIKLDRPRKLKLGIGDMQDVYDHLQTFGKLKEDVDLFKFLRLMAGMHWMAWSAALWAGLRHEDQRIKDGGPDVARKILDGYVRKGEDLRPIAEAIREAMYRSGAMPKEIYNRLKAASDDTGESNNGAEPDEDPTTPAESSI